MPSYQEALQLATEAKFEESMHKLKQSLIEVEKQAGTNTPFHLFIY
jgi:hypothetical protein